MSNVLEAAERLYNLGVTPLWLKTKSKAPVGKGWTEAPRPEFKTLVGSYHIGYNVGVRLGAVSRVGDGYLAILDIDVKSKDPEHKKQAYQRVREFIPQEELSRLPLTRSGRGNGSAHVWFRTTGPATPRRLAQSPDSVEVYIPSVKPSDRDKKVLGEEKVKAGLRLRPAWEISLMGEGQQVVVPPSIHPDSGKPYEWQRELTHSSQLVLIDTHHWLKEAHKDEQTALTNAISKKYFEEQGPIEIVEDFTLDDVTGLDQHIRDLIEGNSDCTDKSVGLFEAAQALVKAGLTRNQILTILSEPGTFLGDACFEHRKTSDRMSAIDWLAKYTVDKAIKNYSAAIDFALEAEVTSLSPDEAEGQTQELVGSSSWRSRLERSSPNTGSRPKNSLANVMLILENVNEGTAVFKYDQFKNVELYASDTPWGGKSGEELKPIDYSRIKVFLIDNFRFEASDDKLYEAVSILAHANAFHPIRDWLESLVWDGVPRVDTWLKDYGGALEPEEYLRAVGRKTIVGLIARVMTPGCKFDTTLVLEGDQGLGKSTFLRNLVGDEYFSDAAINMKDKDSVITQFGIWLQELGEMGTFKSLDDVELQKAFLTRQVDNIRMPYGRKAEKFPRQTVFIGTTNKDDYLKDLTGNRRFWPVKLYKCDHARVKKDREQIFAEAFLLWGLGEPLELPEHLWKVAGEVQDERLEIHDSPMFEDLMTGIKKSGGREKIITEGPIEGEFDFREFALVDAFRQTSGPWAQHYKGDAGDTRRAGGLLRKAGFKKFRKEGQRLWTIDPRRAS